MTQEDQTPTIWTSKGNIPLAQLQRRFGWMNERGEQVQGLPTLRPTSWLGRLLTRRARAADYDTLFFWEEYWLGDECVQRSANGITRRGMFAQAAAGSVS